MAMTSDQLERRLAMLAASAQLELYLIEVKLSILLSVPMGNLLNSHHLDFEQGMRVVETSLRECGFST